MKRKILLWSFVLAAFICVSCAGWDTIQGRTETMVISYEAVGTVGFPTVLAYLQQREKNGSLSGDALLNAKAIYKKAREKYIQAGDIMIGVVNGTSTPVTPATIAVLLREVAIMLADLSASDGGKVEGNKLIVPRAGGIR